MAMGIRQSEIVAAGKDVPHVLITTIPSDSHTWNLMYMRLLVAEHGAAVDCLGGCVPYTHTADQVVAQKPDLVIVSTVNGHGSQQGGELLHIARDRLGASTPPFVIGGQIAVETARYPVAAEALIRAGYERVFYRESAIPAFNRFMCDFVASHANKPRVLTG